MISRNVSSESVARDIRRQTRKKYSADEKVRIILGNLQGEASNSYPWRWLIG
ncbi:MAG: hypothetical protein ACE5EK_00075 [Nitrospinales bacterium]